MYLPAQAIDRDPAIHNSPRSNRNEDCPTTAPIIVIAPKPHTTSNILGTLDVPVTSGRQITIRAATMTSIECSIGRWELLLMAFSRRVDGAARANRQDPPDRQAQTVHLLCLNFGTSQP